MGMIRGDEEGNQAGEVAMSTVVKLAVGLLVLVAVARITATALEVMVMPERVLRIAVLGVAVAALAGGATWALLRRRRAAGPGGPPAR
jgi:hypothetical protein